MWPTREIVKCRNHAATVIPTSCATCNDKPSIKSTFLKSTYELLQPEPSLDLHPTYTFDFYLDSTKTMPFSSFFSDLYYASVAPRVVVAEAPRANVNEGVETGGDNGSSGTAQTRGHAGVRGSVSTKTPASGKASGESGEEAEVNKADASRQKGASSSSGNDGSVVGRNEEKQQQHGGGIKSKLKGACFCSSDFSSRCWVPVASYFSAEFSEA